MDALVPAPTPTQPAPSAGGWLVPYLDLRAAFAAQQQGLMERMREVCAAGSFILRDEVAQFEKAMAARLGVAHAIGVGNGSDALFFALHAAGIGPGDEVVTVAHTFVATIAAIVRCGATPVLADIGDDFNLDPESLARACTPRCRAVIPVHLNGRCCDMKAISRIAREHNLLIIEDAAQSLGATYQGTQAGAFGVAGCFSFHPMKVLGCFGDGGMVVTNDEALAGQVRLLRNHGQLSKTQVAFFGYNSRLDNLQAAILLERLPGLDEAIARRRAVAERYHAGLSGLPELLLPPLPAPGDPHQDVFGSYVVQTPHRDALAAFLAQQGVEVFSHWTPPAHHHPALGLDHFQLPVTERLSARVLSLPIHPEMAPWQVEHVMAACRDFFTQEAGDARGSCAFS